MFTFGAQEGHIGRKRAGLVGLDGDIMTASWRVKILRDKMTYDLEKELHRIQPIFHSLVCYLTYFGRQEAGFRPSGGAAVSIENALSSL